jgi:hypothetical protein
VLLTVLLNAMFLPEKVLLLAPSITELRMAIFATCD